MNTLIAVIMWAHAAHAATCFSFDKKTFSKLAVPPGMADAMKAMPGGVGGDMGLPKEETRTSREYMDQGGDVVLNDNGWIYTNRKTLEVLDVRIKDQTFRRYSLKENAIAALDTPGAEAKKLPGSRSVLGITCANFEGTIKSTAGEMKRETLQSYCTNPSEPKDFYKLAKAHERLFAALLRGEQRTKLKNFPARHFDLVGASRMGQGQAGSESNYQVTKITNDCMPAKFKTPPAGFKDLSAAK